jgi:hypothetical protein
MLGLVHVAHTGDTGSGGAARDALPGLGAGLGGRGVPPSSRGLQAEDAWRETAHLNDGDAA